VREWGGLEVYLCGLVLLAGCSGKQREFAEANPLLPSAEGAADAAVSAPAGSVALGATCSAPSECASGSCADGVCCQSSCDTVCTRCDAPGREGECTVAASDPECSASCPDSTECRSYGSSAESANCAAAGLCRSASACAPTDAPAGLVCANGTGTCDGLGECVVTGLARLGESCTGDAECGEGHCTVGADGVTRCCDSACSGLCRTCDATGRCDDAPPNDSRCSSVDCPVDDICRDYPDDITANLCRGFGVCRNAADCTPTELRPGAECACGPSGCSLGAGVPCTSGDQCASGLCEATSAGGLVCCAEACAALGSTCSASGVACVQCEGTSAQCNGTTSTACNAGILEVNECGDGCNTVTGSCNELRAAGTGCEVAAQCTSGVCSLDVTGTNRCCTADCAASGRACGTDGACVCPASSQDVTGTCRLLDGQACTAGDGCVSGVCAPTVAGPSVCCAVACAAGTFCSADGSACVECEGAASQCAGNVSSRCENGNLVETTCGNGCDTATGVCTGLLATGQACTDGAQCGSTVCTPDITGALRCCTPDCGLTGRVCAVDGSCTCADPSDIFIRGQCRAPEGQACVSAADCRSDACEPTQAGGQVCCTGACNGQICRANGLGCVQCDGGAPTCQGASSRSCVNNAFVTTACGNGCNVTTGLCNNLIPLGGTGCAGSSQCAGTGSSCQGGGRCCEFDCAAAGRICNNDGTCGCPNGTTPVGGACLLGLGQDCSLANECASGTCQRWFRDADGDLHGTESPVDSIQICSQFGAAPPAGYVASSDDCCDDDERANPDQTELFAEISACDNFDFDCNGDILALFEEATIETGTAACSSFSLADCSFTRWTSGLVPQCGVKAGFTACGQLTSQSSAGPRTSCVSVTGGQTVNRCR
jgi:hypothetical protein